MKSFIAILLASIFIFQSASRLFIIAKYEANKEFIAKNLCENKDKPKLHCNGKCHLAKELKKQDKNENAPLQIKEKNEIQYKNTLVFQFKKGKSETTRIITPYLLVSYKDIYLPIFHPPQLVA